MADFVNRMAKVAKFSCRSGEVIARGSNEDRFCGINGGRRQFRFLTSPAIMERRETCQIVPEAIKRLPNPAD